MIATAQLTEWAREFGVLTSVLFTVLLTGISFMWFLVSKQSKMVEDTKELLTVHAKATDGAITRIDAMRTEIDAFRNSDRDLLANMREVIALHAKACEAGQTRACETARDIDAIGRSVERLITILTIKRRFKSDDDNGKT